MANHSHLESAFARYLLSTTHQIVINRTLHSHRYGILVCAKAVAIEWINTPLYVQKQLFVNRKRPWCSDYRLFYLLSIFYVHIRGTL